MDLLIDDYFDAQLALVEKSLSQTANVDVDNAQATKNSKDEPSEDSVTENKKQTLPDHTTTHVVKEPYSNRSRKFRYEDNLATPSKSAIDDCLMPPPPAMVPANLPQADDDGQAQASMLMSWYMAGYHTGYFEAMKKFKDNSNEK